MVIMINLVVILFISLFFHLFSWNVDRLNVIGHAPFDCKGVWIDSSSKKVKTMRGKRDCALWTNRSNGEKASQHAHIRTCEVAKICHLSGIVVHQM